MVDEVFLESSVRVGRSRSQEEIVRVVENAEETKFSRTVDGLWAISISLGVLRGWSASAGLVDTRSALGVATGGAGSMASEGVET